MKASWLPLFRAPKSWVELSFVGEREEDELLNGKILAGGEKVGAVKEGVAAFVEPGYNWPPEDVENLRKSGWIPHNWVNETRQAASGLRMEFCNELASLKGAVLELAAGPGGGNMPPVLSRNPAAELLVNDISIDVLQLWREFFLEKGVGSNVALAAFDGRNMPLRNNSIAAVSSSGGLGSIEESKKAVREVARVLQGGGSLFSIDMVVNPADWTNMPEERRTVWEGEFPGLTGGLAELVKHAGLSVELREVTPGRELDPEEGGLPKDAAKYGVRLHVDWEYLRARKLAENE